MLKAKAHNRMRYNDDLCSHSTCLPASTVLKLSNIIELTLTAFACRISFH